MADALTSLAVTTELEAVNLMLRAAKASPIQAADLTNTLNLDVVNARQTLREVSRKVQTEGWNCNTEGIRDGITISQDVDGKIPLTGDILHVRIWGGTHTNRVSRRGSFLYDLDAGTAVFNKDVKVVLVRFLSFEDLPEGLRVYIAVKAAREFQDDDLGEGSVHDFKVSDEMEARRLARIADGRQTGYNVLTGSYLPSRTLNRYPSASAAVEFIA